MTDYSTKQQRMKRQIFNFVKKVSGGLKRPEQKFSADICYGMLASGSCVLTDVADALQEKNKKVNTVERLSRHLERGINETALGSYQSLVKGMACEVETVVHIDNSDVVKPCGRAFEGLGMVRDGSKSTGSKCVLEKGFYVTEAVALTSHKQPVSVFSEVWSANSPAVVSGGDFVYTRAAIDCCNELFDQVVYVMDRGYDDNYVMQYIEKKAQKFVIRLKSNRTLYINDQKCSVEELCRHYRGKYSMKLFRHGKKRNVKVSCIKGTVAATGQDVSVIIVFGAKHPMVLVTNCAVNNKEEVLQVVTRYFSRWRIEEYFRCKKQSFGFENFRVRSLRSINALNFWLGVCMTFLAFLKERSDSNLLYHECIEAAAPIKDEVHFFYYRLANGVGKILATARSGIRGYFKPLRVNQAQLHIRGFRFA